MTLPAKCTSLSLNICLGHDLWTHPFFCAYLYLFGREVLGAPEHVALSDALAAQLVDLDHAAKCDEAHQGVGWQQAEGHLQRLLQGLQVLLFQTGVHHIEEYQRSRRAALRSAREGC